MAVLGHPKFKGSSSCSSSNCTGTCTLSSSSSTTYYDIKCNGCSSTCRMAETASITKCNNCDYSCAFGCGSTSGGGYCAWCSTTCNDGCAADCNNECTAAQHGIILAANEVDDGGNVTLHGVKINLGGIWRDVT